MSIQRLKLERFTGFNRLDLDIAPGINIFIGANGTGKTHILKVLYAAVDIAKSKRNFADKLVRVFLPTNNSIGRLARRSKGSSRSLVEVIRNDLKLRVTFSNHSENYTNATITGQKDWISHPIESVYIPVKEMLSNAPGFRSLYSRFELHFEEVYADIIDRAGRPSIRGKMDPLRRKLLNILQKAIEGKVIQKNEEFFLKNKQGNLEFPLLAEGMRKLGLLWLLIQNGTLQNGSVLFWDEPETNLNPKLYGVLAEILTELQKVGIQVILATHDYIILKEFDLRSNGKCEIAYHSCYREEGTIKVSTSRNYLNISPNSIAEAFEDVYAREVERSLGKLLIR
jgi:ABC-type ATPase involved in cell division